MMANTTESNQISQAVLPQESPSDRAVNSQGEDLSSTQQVESSSQVQEVAARSIGAKESKRVWYSRLLVVTVLLFSAVLCGTMVFRLSKTEERKAFEGQFIALSKQLIQATQQGEESIARTMEEFATAVTAAVLDLNQTWPFVMIPHFERRAGASRRIHPNIHTLQLATRISPDDDARKEFNDFLNDNMEWYYEALAITGRVAGNTSTELSQYSLPMNGTTVPLYGTEPHIFFTQYSPPPSAGASGLRLDYGIFMNPRWNYMQETKRRARSPVADLKAFIEEEEIDDPLVLYYQPIFRDFSDKQEVVAFASSTLRIQDHFTNLFSNDEVAKGIIVTVKNTCEQVFTYTIDGPTATYVGPDDYHDESFDYIAVEAGLTMAIDDLNAGSSASKTGLHCGYTMTIYPSKEFRSLYSTNEPTFFTAVVLCIFAFTTTIFGLYDCLVQRRQETVMSSAVKTDAIVSSLFPAQFRDRLMIDGPSQTRGLLNNFISGDGSECVSNQKPVADLFPYTTIMFADISGFTSWSSIREPTQVFTLLESIYGEFDKIAKRRKVFKVETVGDAYVAVCGLPEKRADHAVVMARFARDCSMALPRIVLGLERLLGPGTGDIRMRFGLHSGPVVGGILRGDKARFQVFGDTVNTCQRIENNGEPGRIHISNETARLLIEANKESWVKKRPGTIVAKGKGELTTFWLQSTKAGTEASSANEDWSHGLDFFMEDEIYPAQRDKRLIDWNYEQFQLLLKQVVMSRGESTKGVEAMHFQPSSSDTSKDHNVVLDEVTEIITLPAFDARKDRGDTTKNDGLQLGQDVNDQLYKYITYIAQLYRKNPFHSFEHCSHCLMSVMKLLSRIVAPEVETGSTDKNVIAAALHDHTYGITSDPLTQFAVVFSALIHDADHAGVPNGQLAKEDPDLAKRYNSKSIAEQNSVDKAWQHLMSDEFKDLRACIYSNQEEYNRFRQIVVNCVMATDIFDKELSELRKNRWKKAFSEAGDHLGDHEKEASVHVNRKATIVIEHIIQASDVAHTMQHWHVYTKWNEKLFREMYLAYLNGRSTKDPSVGWYAGELWFFDNYVIPLAKKLEECGVFGVSSDEYLLYAVANRDEWNVKGKDIVLNMVNRCRDFPPLKPNVKETPDAIV